MKQQRQILQPTMWAAWKGARYIPSRFLAFALTTVIVGSLIAAAVYVPGLATPSNDGLMPKADKAKVDASCVDIRAYGGSPLLADNTAALQAAINAVSGTNFAAGRRIFIPAGTWHFKSTINIAASGIEVFGVGQDFWDVQNGSILEYDGTAGRAVTDAATTSGAAQISSATAAFTNADVGRTVHMAGTNIGGSGINVFDNPIASVQDAQHATLKAAPQATLANVSATIEDDFIRIGSDDGNPWSSAEYNGYSDTRFHGLSITGVGNTTAADGQPNLYALGTYGIRDWRGGGVILDHCWVSHFEYGFWGVNSDFDQFNWVQFNYCHVGDYHGPRSDQGQQHLVQYGTCDTGLLLDACSKMACYACTFINAGSSTTFGIDVAKSVQFTTLGCGNHLFSSCWFEINTYTFAQANFAAFVRLDSAGSQSPVTGIVFDDCLAGGGVYPAQPSCQYFAQIGHATQVHFRACPFQHCFLKGLHFTATQASRAQVTLIDGTQSGTSVIIPQTDYDADAGSLPAIGARFLDLNGFQFTYQPVNFNLATPVVLSQSADQNSQSLRFNTQGNATDGTTGAVLSGKNLLSVRGYGWDGNAFSAGGGDARFFASATENWNGTSHGCEAGIEVTTNGTIGRFASQIWNHDKSITFGNGASMGSDGRVIPVGRLIVTDNTVGGITNPFVESNAQTGSVGTPGGPMNGVLQSAAGSYVLCGSTSNDDFKLRSNNVNRMEFRRAGEVVRAQSASETTVASGATISTQGVDSVVRVTTTAAVTGVILQTGIATGQVVYLRNNSANTITFAATATSHVAGGASKVIPAWTTVVMEYDGTSWN